MPAGVTKTGAVGRAGGISLSLPSPAGTWNPQLDAQTVDFDRDAFTRFIADKGYCTDPSVLILKSDLTWVRAGDIHVGDELIGFDEHTPGPRLHRRLRLTLVEAKREFVAPRVRVWTDKGPIVVSRNHPFLATQYVVPKPTRYGWVHAEHLKVGAQIMYFASPWKTDASHEAGWLAGMYDGEGCLPNRKNFVELQICQKRGLVERHLRSEVARLGFLAGEYLDQKSDVFTFKTNAIEDVARLIGSIRPLRMLAAFRERTAAGHYPANCRSAAVVLRVEPIEDGVVIALQTTTRTLITDGYLSHNCVLWEKAVLCPNVPGNGLAPRDHAINCQVCDNGLGFVYVNPICTRMLMQGIKLNQSFYAYGRWDMGNMLVTAEPEHNINYWDRLTIQNGVGRFTERLVRQPGATSDKCKYSPLCVDYVAWVDRTGTLVTFGDDSRSISADGTSIEWFDDNQPDAGSWYSVSYTFRPRYVVLDLIHHHRDSTVAGTHYQFPVQAVAKMDFLIRDESKDAPQTVDENPFPR